MAITHYRASEYITKPWKTGSGATDEILLLPEGATRDRFSIRVSSAPIPEPGLFSAFPGIDRAITLIEGAGLTLEFESGAETLDPFVPYIFDSGLAPMGTPADTSVRVVNVMIDRAAWRFGDVRVHNQTCRADPGPGGMVFVFAITDGCRVETGAESVALNLRDSVRSDGPVDVVLDAGHGARALVCTVSRRATA